MADERREASAVTGRPIDLAGDSPELIAFALLRYLAQFEQQGGRDTFDRAWMLDAYAECLEAVHGKRPIPDRTVASAATATSPAATLRRRAK